MFGHLISHKASKLDAVAPKNHKESQSLFSSHGREKPGRESAICVDLDNVL